MKRAKFIRKLYAFIFPLIFITAYAFSSSAQTGLSAPAYVNSAVECVNLLSDGGFENSTYSVAKGVFGLSEDWKDDADMFTPNSDNKHRGEYSVSVTCRTCKVISYAPITLERGKIYNVGAFALMPIAQRGSVIPAFTVSLTKNGDSSAVKSATLEFNGLAINEWHEFGFSAEIKETGEYVVSFSAKGTEIGDVVYVDDLYVTEETAATSDKVAMVTGASVRLNKEHGIRFIGRVDYEYSQGFGECVFGIILVPTDYLTDVTAFTVAGLEAADKKYVKAERDASFSPEYRFSNYETFMSDGYYEFTCALVKILDKNVKREFSARAYVRYVDESTGISRYVYSDYSQEKNSRSVYYLASYWLTKPELFTEEQVKILENYVTVGDAQA